MDNIFITDNERLFTTTQFQEKLLQHTHHVEQIIIKNDENLQRIDSKLESLNVDKVKEESELYSIANDFETSIRYVTFVKNDLSTKN